MRITRIMKWFSVLVIFVCLTFLLLKQIQVLGPADRAIRQRQRGLDNTNNPFQVMPTLISPFVKSDNSSWTFRNKIQCPQLAIVNTTSKRCQFNVRCIDSGPNISFGVAEAIKVTSFSFGNQCLSDVIDKYCTDELPVPNVLHYVWYGNIEVKFHHFLSFMSAVRFMNPCLIVFHGEQLPYGKYWDYFTSIYFRLMHLKRSLVTEVHGVKLSFKEHGSDIMRIEALYKYGGVYMDTDTVLLRSIDDLRKYNCTMGHEYKTALGNQFIMAGKGAKFLELWHEAYKQYRRGHWDYNSLYVPFQIAQKNPTIIHIESDKFTRPNYYNLKHLFQGNFNWSDNYAMHLYIRMYKTNTDELIVRGLNTTYGSVSRHILLGNKDLCL